jgi:serine/threonine protein kinase/WD40 repeat protein
VSTRELDSEQIFNTAAEIEDLKERAAYLGDVCGDNQELRAEVESLLKSEDDVGDFLEAPIFGLDVTADDSHGNEGAGSVIGSYKLLEKIGEGGFGVIWAAEQKRPVKRRVALKIIKLGMDTKQVVARFEAERQALALMDHPNIAKVLDAGSTDAGRPYFVMELVRGIPIIEYCDQVKLSIQDRLGLFIKVCHAIQHAHQKGIIHRDIKPSNILITLHDGVPVPRIIDFGIAKATQQELTEMTIYTQHHQFIGTPVYMSPEQAEMSGLDIDTRSDIYSLGVLLYELLTGRTPFDEKELMQAGIDRMRKIIREREPQKPSTKFATLQMEEQSTTATRYSTDSPRLISLLRGDLDWIVMKCLEKDRTRRYETANGLAMDVVRHLSNEPVVARPPTVIYQLRKAWRRNKVVYTAACMVMASLIIGISLSVWQAWVAIEARRDAEAARKDEYTLRTKAQESERKQRLTTYASDMRVAQEYLKVNNFGLVVELLKRHLPKPGHEDLRGIEWRYLWQACEGDEIHTFRHEERVSSISLSDDGTRLASISMDGKIRLFDVVSRRLLRQQGGGLRDQQDGSIALSRDGHLLAADEQGTLRVRNAESGKLIFEQEHATAPIDFSPDGRYLAGVTEAGLRIWNTTDWTSRLLGESLGSYTYYSTRRSLAFTPDSSRVIFCPAQMGNKLEVWNLTDNTMEGELSSLKMERPCAISTDGSIVAAGGWEGYVCVWDLPSRSIVREFKAHDRLVFGIALSPDGKTLATGGSDQMVRLWNTRKFEKMQEFKGHRSQIWNLKFSRNGRVLASAGNRDHSVKLWQWKMQTYAEWDYLVPENLYCRGFSESGDVLRFYDPNEWPDFSRSGGILPPGERPPDFGSPRSRTDHFLDLSTSQWARVSRSDGKAIAQATSMAWKSGQDTELFGKDDGTVVLSDGTATRSIHVADHPVRPLLLSPKDRYLLLNVLPKKADPYAILWDREAEGVGARIEHRFGTYTAISPDERFLAYDGGNYTVKLWNIPEKRQWAILHGNTFNFYGFEFSPDSRLLVSYGWNGDCRLWDVEKGAKADPHLLRGHHGGVNPAVFSPDGRTLATCSFDGMFKLWSVATGRELFSSSLPMDTFPNFHNSPMMAAKADRLVWAGYPEGHPLRGSKGPMPLRVTTLPTLAEIDDQIRRQSSGETSPGSG